MSEPLNLGSILTDAGKNMIANHAAYGTQFSLDKFAVGSGTNILDASSKTLTEEQYRANISHAYVHPDNPNWLVIEGYIPQAVGGWYIREIGIYAEGYLFAVANVAESYKPKVVDGEAVEGTVKDVNFRFIIQISDAESVVIKIDPTIAMASQAWVLAMLDTKSINQISKDKEYRVPSQFPTVEACLLDICNAMITNNAIVTIILEEGDHYWPEQIEVKHISGSRIQILGETAPTNYPVYSDYTGDKAVDKAMCESRFPVRMYFQGEFNALKVTGQLGAFKNVAMFDETDASVDSRSAILAGDNNYVDMNTIEGARSGSIASIENVVCFGFKWGGIYARFAYIRCQPTTACVHSNADGYNPAQMSYLIARDTLSMYNAGSGYLSSEKSTMDIEGSKSLRNVFHGVHAVNSFVIAAEIECSNNQKNGLHIEDSEISLHNAIINENGNNGVLAWGKSHIYGNGAEVHTNGGHGISMADNATATMRQVDCRWNELNGVNLYNTSDCNFPESVFNGNKNCGIFVDHCGGNLFHNCEIQNNTNRPVVVNFWGQTECSGSTVNGTPNPVWNTQNAWCGMIRKA